jgi:hypothetical protein
MALRRSAAGLAIAVLAGSGALAPALAARADNSPPSQVLSNYESSTGGDMVRDCGYSTPLPADPSSSLWLFCDTADYGFGSSGQWGLQSFLPGSSAAQAPSNAGEVPTDLSELTTPGTGLPTFPNDDAPAQFLPTPAGLQTASGLPCDSANDAYAASWSTGLTADAAKRSDVLITYVNYCVPTGGGDPVAEGFGIAQYDPATNTLDSQVTVVSSADTSIPVQEQLGAPIFDGRYLYLFGSYCADVYDATCVSASGDGIYLARVPASAADWSDAADYQWYAGPSTWTPTDTAATSLISGATPLAVNVASFASLDQGLVLVEETNLAGGFTVYEASAPAGTWAEKTSGTVPCTDEGDSFCRAIIPHPELSTTSDLLLSFFNPAALPYYNPAEGTQGHVMVAEFGW